MELELCNEITKLHFLFPAILIFSLEMVIRGGNKRNTASEAAGVNVILSKISGIIQFQLTTKVIMMNRITQVRIYPLRNIGRKRCLG